MTGLEQLAAFRLRLCTMQEFDAAEVSPRVREIVHRVVLHWGGTHVVYDLDGDEGWLLVGDDPDELTRETLDELAKHEAKYASPQLKLF